MPVDFADAFKAEPAKPAAPPPGVPDSAPPPAPAKPPAERGIDIEKVFADKPKAPAPASSIAATAKRVGGKLGELNKALSEQTQEQVFGPIAEQFADSYVDFIQQGRNYQKGQGTLETLKQGAQQLLDVLGMTGAWAAPVQKAVVDPIHQQIQKLGKISGGDPEIQGAVDTLADMFDAAYWTAFGGEGKAATPSVAKAGMRMASKDLREAVKPPETERVPPQTQLAAGGIDKSMGFQKINDTVGKEMQKVPAGTKTNAKQLVDQMLPHSDGYAKSFLEKLQEHMDEPASVEFAGEKGAQGNRGFYQANAHKIVLQVGKDDILQTAVHEIVHSTTSRMLSELVAQDITDWEAEAGRPMKPQEKLALVNNPRSPVLKELDAIIKEARVRAAKAGRLTMDPANFEIRYGLAPQLGEPHIAPGSGAREFAIRGMSPRHEFVAQLFSSPDFQEFLANSEKYASAGYKWKNMLNQFTQLIGRHLGMKGQEMQLLSQAMRVGTQLIKLQDITKPPKRGMTEIIGKIGDEVMTRQEIERASRISLPDTPRIRAAERTVRISVEQVIRGISPESLGERAKLAAATIARRLSQMEQKTSAWHYGSETRSKFWRMRPDMQRQFLEKAERGERFSDPALQKLADKYKKWGEDIFQQDTKNGFNYEARENYFSHIFEESPEDIAAYFNEHYGSKWGDPSFIKDRSFDLYKEAIAAGFHPRFESPEDIMLARQHASDIAEMHNNILQDMERFGLATKKIEGKEEFKQVIGPEGKVSWEVERTEGTKQPDNTTRRRSPTGDVYWVDNQAFAVVKNAFDSKSLWADRGVVGTAFKGMMGLKNALIPIRLALSLFHPLHVMGIDMAAGFTRATSELLSGGNPITFAGKMLKSGLNPFVEAANIPLGLVGVNRGGWRVMKAWKGAIAASKLTAEDAEALKILAETGVSPEMSSQYRTNARQNFMNALRDTMVGVRDMRPGAAVGGATRTMWHFPWAVVSAMAKPAFEQWIPALKAASAIKDAKSVLARNPELVENESARLLAMRRIGKSIDNRYGEMAYNKLFWQRWIKDLSVLNTLSLGWQLGFIREYGGGMLDLGQFAKGEGKLARIKKGELDKAIFVSSYTSLGAGMAGLMTYAFTGEFPTGMDYINPRTGEKNPDGSDQRVTTMFYSREFASLYKHMVNEGAVHGIKETVANKGSGLFGLMYEWAVGQNSFGQEIRDPNGTLFQQVEQTVAYTMADAEPISLKSIQENVTDQLMKAGVLTVMGFNPEPKYMSETPTQAHIKQEFHDYMTGRATPYDKAEQSKEYAALRKAYESGADNYGDLLDSLAEKFNLSGTEQRRLIRNLNSPLTSSQRMFMRLPWKQQFDLLDKMTPEERDDYLPHSNKQHVRNVWVPPEERQAE